jgi:hypothetical protein
MKTSERMNHISQPSTRTAIGMCLCVLTIALAGSPALAATCSNASLNGVFGYSHGRPGGASTVNMVTGQLTLDGQGNITSALWTWETSDGTVSSGTTTGTYSVSTNCTGTLTLNDEDNSPNPSHFNIYLNAGNTMFQIIQSDQNWNQPGFGLAQGTVTCGLSGKKLALTTNLVGLVSGAPADSVGRVTLEGNGGISGTETFAINVVTKLAVAGTYTENANCTGTWQITPTGGTASNFNAVVVNSGKELLLLQTDANTFAAGTAQEAP